jgi:hypothetical protein
VVGLSAPEKAEAAHGDIRVPASSVRDVEVLDVVVHAVHGLKFPGARWPGRFAIGTFYLPGETKTFAVVHHDTPRGLRVRLDDAAFDELRGRLRRPRSSQGPSRASLRLSQG